MAKKDSRPPPARRSEVLFVVSCVLLFLIIAGCVVYFVVRIVT